MPTGAASKVCCDCRNRKYFVIILLRATQLGLGAGMMNRKERRQYEHKKRTDAHNQRRNESLAEYCAARQRLRIKRKAATAARILVIKEWVKATWTRLYAPRLATAR